MATTTIPVERETRDRLRSLGKKGETYDEILKRLMSLAVYEEFMGRQYERLKDKKALSPWTSFDGATKSGFIEKLQRLYKEWNLK